MKDGKLYLLTVVSENARHIEDVERFFNSFQIK